MKTLSKLGMIAALSGYLFLSSCAGEYERPAPPYGGAVWIEGDWVWSGGRYVRHRGYWARPRAGRAWVAGSWNHGPRGYAWRRGHWR